MSKLTSLKYSKNQSASYSGCIPIGQLVIRIQRGSTPLLPPPHPPPHPSSHSPPPPPTFDTHSSPQSYEHFSQHALSSPLHNHHTRSPTSLLLLLGAIFTGNVPQYNGCQVVLLLVLHLLQSDGDRVREVQASHRNKFVFLTLWELEKEKKGGERGR